VPVYDVEIDPARKLLIIRLAGFWTPETMKAYQAEVRRKASALHRAGGCERILVDMSDYPIQSAEIAEGHASALRHAADTLCAKAAIVMTSALSKLQASRVATSTGHRFFTDETLAFAWLADGEI